MTDNIRPMFPSYFPSSLTVKNSVSLLGFIPKFKTSRLYFISALNWTSPFLFFEHQPLAEPLHQYRLSTTKKNCAQPRKTSCHRIKFLSSLDVSPNITFDIFTGSFEFISHYLLNHQNITIKNNFPCLYYFIVNFSGFHL